MSKSFKVILVCLSLLLCLSKLTLGQTPTGVIEGTITDPNGALVNGANVTVTEIATNRSINATTSEQGFFTVRNLTPGQYSVRVESAGFAASVINNLTVQVGQVSRADIALQVGTGTTTVDVTADDVQLQVDTTRQTVDGVVNAQQIQALPLNSRNPLDLAETNRAS